MSHLGDLIIGHGPYTPYELVPLAVQRFIESDELNALRDELIELADMRRLFDMQQTRMEAATARWRAEDPAARALILPDLGALLEWLMGDVDRLLRYIKQVHRYGGDRDEEGFFLCHGCGKPHPCETFRAASGDPGWPRNAAEVLAEMDTET